MQRTRPSCNDSWKLRARAICARRSAFRRSAARSSAKRWRSRLFRLARLRREDSLLLCLLSSSRSAGSSAALDVNNEDSAASSPPFTGVGSMLCALEPRVESGSWTVTGISVRVGAPVGTGWLGRGRAGASRHPSERKSPHSHSSRSNPLGGGATASDWRQRPGSWGSGPEYAIPGKFPEVVLGRELFGHDAELELATGGARTALGGTHSGPALGAAPSSRPMISRRSSSIKLASLERSVAGGGPTGSSGNRCSRNASPDRALLPIEGVAEVGGEIVGSRGGIACCTIVIFLICLTLTNWAFDNSVSAELLSRSFIYLLVCNLHYCM